MNYQRIITALIFLFVFPSQSWGDKPSSTLPTLSPHSSQDHPKASQTKDEFWQQLELVGIIINEPNGKNVAFIENRQNNHQDVYSIGAQILGGAKIAEIQAKSVVLEKGGVFHKLALRQSLTDSNSNKSGYQKISPTEWRINAPAMFPSLWDVAKAFTGVRIAKYSRSDDVAGLRINEISQDHLLKEIGFEEEDIVEEINGHSVDSISGLIDYLWKLDGQSDVRVSLDRQGKKKVFKYLTSSCEPSYFRRQVKQATSESGLTGVTASVSW